MRTKNYILCMLAIFALSLTTCGDDGDNNNDVPIIDNGEKPLLGTSWKLVGVVNEDGTLREFEPTDCAECYTLFFDSVAIPCILPLPTSLCPDVTFSGHSEANRVCGTYCANYVTYEFMFANYIQTTAGSMYEEERLWHHFLSMIVSFSLQDDELKLYSGENKYMLFEPYNVNLKEVNR